MRDEYDFSRDRWNPCQLRRKECALVLEAWQIKEIRQALKEADAGDFIPAEDLAKIVKRFAS
jgi:predicted transcriptional regulator